MLYYISFICQANKRSITLLSNCMKNEDTTSIEHKYNKSIKSVILMIAILVGLRAGLIDIIGIASEALNAVILFIFLIVKGKCMAILILICSVAAGFVGAIRINHILLISKSNYGHYLSNLDFWVTVYSLVIYMFEFLIAYTGIRKYLWENVFQAGRSEKAKNSNYGTFPDESLLNPKS